MLSAALVQDSYISLLLNFGRITILETESLTVPPNCPDIMQPSRLASITAKYSTAGIWNNGVSCRRWSTGHR